jgi:peptidoglycan hydrolase-like protein with peptidoglycan-binding domain
VAVTAVVATALLLAGATWQYTQFRPSWAVAGQSQAHSGHGQSGLSRLARPEALEVQRDAVPTSEVPFPTLGVGARGSEVRTVQLLLRYRRYDLLDDGHFGPLTAGVVRDFQAKHNLEASGIVDAQTWERLIVPVGRGSRGEPVQAVQLLLTQKYEARLAIDGDFGAQTEAAVVRFQEQAGLRADGIVELMTWRHLMRPIAVSGPE